MRFLSYHGAGRFDFKHLGVSDETGLVAVLPGGRIERDGSAVFKSPLGASFGGFVFRKPDLRRMLETAKAVQSNLALSGFGAVEMSLPPSCYYSLGDENIRYLMTAAGYRLYERDATSVIPLGDFDGRSVHDVLARNVRKAEESGLEVRAAQGRDLEGFYRVLVKNLTGKGLTPTHSLEEIKHLTGIFPDRIVIFAARAGGEVVGGCLVMLCNERAGLAFYICDDPDRRPLAVAESALYHAAVWLKQRGVLYFDLGTVSRGAEINWGLVQFKSKFGSKTYVREHYRMDLSEGAA